MSGLKKAALRLLVFRLRLNIFTTVEKQLKNENQFTCSRHYPVAADLNDMSRNRGDKSDSPSPNKLLAEAMGKLTIQERERSYEDVHGVTRPIIESPKLIEDCLREMEDEIHSIPKKEAYELAESFSKDFVSDRKLRIAFLRAEVYDAKKAANRLVYHFKTKLELFGRDKLVKQIAQHDLDDDCIQALRKGAQQILPNRDSRGRPVVVSFPSVYFSLDHGFEDPFSTLAKVWWYVIMSLADDEDTQKHGFVYVVYNVGKMDPMDDWGKELLKYIGENVVNSIMLTARSIHRCYNSPSISPLWTSFVSSVDSFLRVRTRTHYGSDSECQYKLMTFGIPMKNFPVDDSGITTISNHHKWLGRRKKKEEFLLSNAPIDGAVDLPSRIDVLLGRGTPFNHHHGNRHLHEVVESHYDQYCSEIRVGKTKLAEDIVVMIHECSGRFLKQHDESGMWVEVTKLEARNKVSHCFRRKREYESKSSNKDSRKKEATKDVQVIRFSENDGGGKRQRATPVV